MNKRIGFILYKNYWQALQHLSDEQLGRLTRAIYLYELGQEQEIDDDIAAVFELIRMQLDLNDEKYDTAVEQNEHSKPRRGNPKFKKGQPNPYRRKKCDDTCQHDNSQQLEIITADNNENNNIDININKNYSLREKEKREPPEREMKNTRKNNQQLDLSAVAPEYREVVDEWLAYKNERNQHYGQIGFNVCYKRLLTLSCQSPDKAREIVEQSIANNWVGLFEIRTCPKYETYEERRKRESEQRELEFKQAVERIMNTKHEERDLSALW